MKDTDARYKEALSLYQTTDLSVVEICRQTDTPVAAFRAYLRRRHRHLILARYGIDASPEEAGHIRLRKARGQSPQTHAKYKDAIAACDNRHYIALNISQIAAMFSLNPTSLGKQLRNHFPDILERRESARLRLGLDDKFHRGSPKWCREQYAGAIRHLRETDDTIAETARLLNLSYSGLREHLLGYHKKLVEEREGKRRRAKGRKKIGSITGNGKRHLPSEEQVKRYEEATSLYRDTAMTMKEIATATGISLNGFKNYLRMWHVDLMLQRRGVEPAEVADREEALRGSKQYLKSSAAKYAEAIEFLKNTPQSTAAVADRFDLHPDCFREYLREHQPELAASLGMKRLGNGQVVLARSAEKYGEAIDLYSSSSESLASIARRLGLTYNSLNSFINRNCPEAILSHNRMVEAENTRKKTKT